MLAASVFLSVLLLAQEAKPPAPEPAPQDHPQDLPIDPFEEEGGLRISVALRAGGWRTGPFDAVIPGGRRRIDQSLLFDAGVDVRADYDPITLTLGGDYAVGRDLQLTLGSLLVGVKI